MASKYRKKLSRRKSKSQFVRRAKTKMVNVAPPMRRGGYRM